MNPSTPAQGRSRVTEAMLGDSVLTHARRDYAVLKPDWTVGEALDHLRATPPADRIVYFYVTDPDDHLLGVIPTRRLLFAPVNQKISDMMIRQVVSVPANATVLDACEFFTLYRFLAFPVVGPDRVLLGVIDVELYTDELTETGGGLRDNLFQLIGVHLAQANKTTPLRAFQGRFPWLLCNVAGGLFAAFLSGVFQNVLGWKEAVLAIFVPVVLGVAESVSIQSVTLALQRAEHGGWWKSVQRIGREALTGFLLGGATALIIAIVALVWQKDVTVAAVVFGGMTIGMTLAAAVGFAIPNLLRLTKREPHVAAGPISLVAADTLTLLTYFLLARALIA
ncbi:MAG: CBS domain-containing protein [Gemmataceae bacterium]